MACTLVDAVQHECPDFPFVHNGLSFKFKAVAASCVCTKHERSFERVNVGSLRNGRGSCGAECERAQCPPVNDKVYSMVTPTWSEDFYSCCWT